MTQNQIRNRELRERERHNREDERLTRRGQNIRGVTDTIKGKGISSVISKINDPSWYNTNRQLVEDVARVSYRAPLGSPSRLPSHITGSPINLNALPGIMTIRTVASIGVTGSQEASAINVAAKNIYAFIRHANSGASNYEAADMMMYLLAMDSAYSVYASLCRLYSTVMTASAENWYWIQAMIRAQGFDPTDVRSNVARLRGLINMFAQKLSSFNVPDSLSFFIRHIWMYTNIFKDANIERAQLMMYKMAYYHTYSASGGSCTAVQWGTETTSGGITVANINTTINNIINALIMSEDIGIISGDILKAYGSDRMFKTDTIQEEFRVEPTYSEEVLSQINGAILVGTPFALNELDFYQNDTGQIRQGGAGNTGFSPRFTIGSFAGTASDDDLTGLPDISRTIVNMYKDNVTADDTMVATRATITGKWIKPAATTLGIEITSCGSEIFLDASLWTYNNSGVLATSSYKTYNFTSATSIDATSIRPLSNYLKFDWAPRLWVDTYSYADKVWTVNELLAPFDITNYAVLDQTTLSPM